MENKIFGKNISVDCVFYGFDPEIGLHFYFHYKPFSGLRCAKRERERRESYRSTQNWSQPSTGAASTPTLAPPYISHHHRDRITIEDRSTQIDHTQTDPPKIASPQTNHTHRDRITIEDRFTQNRSYRRHRYPWPISSPSCRYPWPISSLSRSRLDLITTQDRTRLNLVAHDPWPISPFPSIFDHSLFLPISVWLNGGV